MKKILLLMVAILVTISAMGQPVTKKTQIIQSLKQKSFKNLHNPLSKGVKLDSTINQTWDDVNLTFVINRKSKFTYTPGAMEQTDSLFYVVTNKWVPVSQTEYSFDANGDPTLEITSTSAITLASPSWVNSTKTEFTYDINNNLTQYIAYTWNTSLSQWVGVMKTETTFDINGDPILEVTSSWDIPSSSWVPESKTASSYDANGNIITAITYVWDNTITIPGYVNSTKTDYTFNGSGQMTLFITSDWDKTLTIPAWVNSTKTVLAYDTGGNRNVMTTYNWDKTLAIPDWVGEMKIETTYDANSRPATAIVSLWDTGNSVWVAFSKTVSTYDNVFNTAVTYDETNGFVWDVPSLSWKTSSRTDDYYSNLATLVNKTSEGNLRVYPNPAKEFVVFDNFNISESATIELFDIQGRKIMDKQLYGNDQISVKDLAKGMYVYKLHNSGITYTGKLLKK